MRPSDKLSAVHLYVNINAETHQKFDEKIGRNLLYMLLKEFLS